jgi:hypothetical protein
MKIYRYFAMERSGMFFVIEEGSPFLSAYVQPAQEAGCPVIGRIAAIFIREQRRREHVARPQSVRDDLPMTRDPGHEFR